MRLSQFIIQNMEEILVEWEAFASSLLAEGQVMTPRALRNHARQILLAIAEDIETNQTDLEQAYKSKSYVTIPKAAKTAAHIHGALRHLSGFDLGELSAEYRALRASVLRLWLRQGLNSDSAFYEMTRFNESIDQALAESIVNYSNEVAKSRDTFLAILGHDLRTPLSAIANSSLYLGSPGLLPPGAPLDAVRRIGRSVDRMNSMIKDLLEYTKMRLGRAIPISPQPTSMEQICTLAFDEIRAAHPEHVFGIQTSGELEGVFDGERIHQVLTNLLSNAVQHGTRGEPITLSAHGEPGRITVKVKNFGQPIPADQLLVIFNPLVQIPAVSKDAATFPASLGLGLYIVHEIVAMHGGTVVAESSEEDGTVFSASLPRSGLSGHHPSV